jgi:hypothetical protein
VGGFPALELSDVKRQAALLAGVARRMKLAAADLSANPVRGSAAEIRTGGDAIECRARWGRERSRVGREAEDLAAEARLEEPF